MKKKLLFALLLMLVFVCAFAILASAAEVDGVYYTLDSDGTATVNTENKTATATIASIPSTITVDGVPYKVDAISSGAFNGNKTVTEIRILSEYITKIPSDMILNTYEGSLSKIYIDFSNITSIGSAAFNPSNQSNGNGPKANSFYYYDAKAFIENGTDVKITCPDFSNCTSIGSAAFQGANFDELVIPPAIAINTQTFRMSTIQKLTIQGTTRETIGYWSFNSCASLKEIRVESTNLKKMQTNVFSGLSSLEKIYIDLSKCTEFNSSAFVFAKQYDNGNTITAWYDLDGNKRVDLSSAKIINGSAFASSNLGGNGETEIIWPQSLSTLDDQAFRRCNIQGTMYINMDASVTGKSFPYYNMHGNQPTLLILGPSFTSIDCQFEVACTVVALADSVSVTYNRTAPFKDSANSTLYCKSATIAHYTQPTVVNFTSGAASYSKTCGITATLVTAGGNVKVGTDTHNYSLVDYDNTYCPINTMGNYLCSKCEGTKQEANEGTNPVKNGHDISNVIAIAYEKGFTVEGVKTLKCVNCAQTEEVKAEKVFDFLGFSTKDDASGASLGITFGYKVNIEELEAYEKENGALSSYGFVVAFKALLGDNTPIKADGSVNTVDGCNIIVAGTNSTEQSALTTINFVLTGPKALWESDDYQIGDAATLKDAELVMAGYVIEDGAISYFQDRTVQAVQALEAQTYNGVCGA